MAFRSPESASIPKLAHIVFTIKVNLQQNSHKKSEFHPSWSRTTAGFVLRCPRSPYIFYGDSIRRPWPPAVSRDPIVQMGHCSIVYPPHFPCMGYCVGRSQVYTSHRLLVLWPLNGYLESTWCRHTKFYQPWVQNYKMTCPAFSKNRMINVHTRSGRRRAWALVIVSSGMGAMSTAGTPSLTWCL